MKPAIILLAIGAVIGIIWGRLTLNGDSQPSIVVASPAQVATVIKDLGPGDTLHIVMVEYRSPESVGEKVAAISPCQTGWVRNESWQTFGSDGVLVASHGEAHTEDGVLCGTTKLQDGEDVFLDAHGKEYFRMTDERLKPPLTASAVRAAMELGHDLATEALAKSEALGNEQVVVLEEVYGGGVEYQYILPDVGFAVKTENWRVDRNGEKTLETSTHFEVYEILGR